MTAFAIGVLIGVPIGAAALYGFLLWLNKFH